MKQGIYTGLSNKDYHDDKGTFSSSLIKKMAVPAEAKYSMDNSSEHKECFRIGSAVHKFILEREQFDNEFIVPIQGVRRSGKDNLRAWASWFDENGACGDSIVEGKADSWYPEFERQTGKNIVTQEEVDNISMMAEAVKMNADARLLLTGGDAESSVYWKDDETGLTLKVRPDYLSIDISDLKTIRAADDRTIWSDVNRFGYPISAEMYRDGVYQVTGEYKDFVFIFVNTKPPYFCRTFVLSDEMAEHGYNSYRWGVRRLAECLDSGLWPGYSDERGIITSPYQRDDILDMDGVEVEL